MPFFINFNEFLKVNATFILIVNATDFTKMTFASRINKIYNNSYKLYIIKKLYVIITHGKQGRV